MVEGLTHTGAVVLKYSGARATAPWKAAGFPLVRRARGVGVIAPGAPTPPGSAVAAERLDNYRVSRLRAGRPSAVIERRKLTTPP